MFPVISLQIEHRQKEPSAVYADVFQGCFIYSQKEHENELKYKMNDENVNE